MKKMLIGFYIKAKGMIENERGSQSLEWIGIAAVIVILTGAISTAFSGGQLGSTFMSKFTNLLDKIVQ